MSGVEGKVSATWEVDAHTVRYPRGVSWFAVRATAWANEAAGNG